MQGLFENKALCYLTTALYGAMGLLASEGFPSLNEWLQLVPLPSAFRATFTALLVYDTVAVIVIDKLCLYFFPYR